jgi:hypothetical protein
MVDRSGERTDALSRPAAPVSQQQPAVAVAAVPVSQQPAVAVAVAVAAAVPVSRQPEAAVVVAPVSQQPAEAVVVVAAAPVSQQPEAAEAVVAVPVSRQPGAAAVAVAAMPVSQQPEAAEAVVAVPVSQQPGAAAEVVVAMPVSQQPEAAKVARPALVRLPAQISSRRADCPAEAAMAVPWSPAVIVRLAAHWSEATPVRPALVLLPAQTSSRRADCPAAAAAAVPWYPAVIVRLAVHRSAAHSPAAMLARQVLVRLTAQTSSRQAERLRRADCPAAAAAAVPWYPAVIVRLAVHRSAAHSPAAMLARPALVRLTAQISSRQAERLRRADCPAAAAVAVPCYPAGIVRLVAHWSTVHSRAARLARPALVRLPARTSSRRAERLRRADCPAEVAVAVPWSPAVIVRPAVHRSAARWPAVHSPAARLAQAASVRLRARPSSRRAVARPRRADCRAEAEPVVRPSPVRLDPMAQLAAQGLPGTALALAVAAFLRPVGPAADWA